MMKRCLALVSSSLAAAAALVATGCADDVALPYELDHARVLAVRTAPAVVPSGGAARFEVLFTDSSAQPRLADAGELVLRIPELPPILAAAEQRGGLDVQDLLSRDERGWQLRSPSAETLQAARAALGLGDDAPLLLPVDLELTTVDGTLRAQKQVAFGAEVVNPPAPDIMLAGQAAETAQLASGDDVEVSIEGPRADDTYRWFTSLGELRRYTQAVATLSPELAKSEERDEGYLVVVVRTGAGGISWRIVSGQVAAR